MKDSNLNFDGMTGDGVNRSSNRYAGNQHTQTNSGALINKGRGPTVGNKSDKDSTYPPSHTAPAVTPGKDMFTGKPQVRTPGGTRAWEPKAGQNYTGNADKINSGRGPTKGNE